MTELWDLYNEKREKTGLTLERGQAVPKGHFHLVVSVWIRNSQGQYLLSKRHPGKSYPGYWECTGGSVMAGESSLDGAVREVNEELGVMLCPDNARLLYQTRRDSTQDFYDVWLFHADIPLTELKLQETEVVDARWVSKDTLLHMFRNKELHPLLVDIEKILSA